MSERHVVLVDDGGLLRVGWVQAHKPGRPLRVHARGLGGDVAVLRVERRELAAELHALAADLADAEAQVERLRTRVSAADLELAWGLLADRPLGIGELAEVLFGKDDPAARDAATVAAALGHAGFALDHGRLLRRDAQARQAAEREAERVAGFAADIARWRAILGAHRQGLRTRLDDLPVRLQQLVLGHADPALAHWLCLDGRHKRGDARDAVDLLNELRVWDGHEDLELWLSRALVPWPDPAPAGLRDAPDLPADAPRLDLPFVAIDSEAPHEVDDAICLTPLGQAGTRLHVAIAHPSAWLQPDSEADLEARRRAATLYHPRHVVGMLPDALARGAASLQVAAWRPALVVSVTLDADGDPREPELQEAWVRVAHAWSYDAVARALAGDAAPGMDVAQLRAMQEAAQRAEAARIRRGAWLLYRPECEVSAPPFAAVQVRGVAQTSPGRRLITEWMVQAGAAVAEIAQRHRVAVPFRTQARPAQAPLAPGVYDDAAACFAMFRVLDAATMQVTPAPHGMMAVPAYVQFTSPLRRYADLLAHRQLVAFLRAEAPPHSPQQLQALAQQSDERARAVRQWQRRGAHYFKLLWLAARVQGPPLDAQVVRVLASGERLVFLPSLAMEATVRVPGAAVGDYLRLRVAGVHPARGQIEFHAVPT